MDSDPARYRSVEPCVEETLRSIGKRVRLGIPLGIGKPNQLVNEFFRRATADPSIELTIFTALSLGRPRWSNDLERRFVEPLSERLFGGYPELAYLDPLRRGELPDNIRVHEFYFRPGGFMRSPLAQRRYVSSNYTHVVRDLMDAGVNVLAQLVGREKNEDGLRYSLGSNSDLTVDLVPKLRERRRRGAGAVLLAQVNARMPFMYGDAEVAPDYFDAVVEDPDLDFPLFGVPNVPVESSDYMTALHVATLVRDGGTIQIGIGSMGDAVTRMLQLRHEENATFRAMVEAVGIPSRHERLLRRWGGLEPFEEGLYASSEMLVDGFLALRRSGILRRSVYDEASIQRLVNEGRLGEEVTDSTLDLLMSEGVIGRHPSEGDLRLLERFGFLRRGVRLEDGEMQLPSGARVPADLGDAGTREALRREALGDRLRGGHVAHACFFLGPRAFYEALRAMPPEERRRLSMTGISFVNELHGQEELKRLQRRHARFINAGLIATLGGAVASDGLEDGRVISGVGGQYNFVAMAHALEGGRSLLMISGTDERHGDRTSNIRFSYGHTTIPRHLRDLVITEYGVADLRGRSDEEVAMALVEVADARFQEDLIDQAKQAGKLASDYELPAHARNNTPERIEGLLAPYRRSGFFERFPFGTDLTEEELVLRKALTMLKRTATREEIQLPGVDDIKAAASVPERARPYLERMQLESPADGKERLLQAAVLFALSSVDAI